MSPSMRHYVYEEVTVEASKVLRCPDCGKTVKRAKTFMNTFNPFNRDPDTGLPRTERQIREKLSAEATEWRRVPERCTPCRERWAHV